jgi:predicted translin family RNA/ssDNA-binding protein
MRDYAEVYQDMKIKMHTFYQEMTDGDREKALKLAADIKILSAELIQSLLAK